MRSAGQRATAAAIAVIFATGAYAAEICPGGVLSIGTDATFPPYSSKVGDDFVGYEIDLGEALARLLGCRAKWANYSFDGIFPALLAGRCDLVLASVTITPERRRSLLFSDPYLEAGLAIAVRHGAAPVEGVEGLRGKRVGVGLNTTGQYFLERYDGIDLVKFPSVDLALMELRNARIDAAVGDSPVFRYIIRQSFPDIVISGQPLNREQWAIALAPGKERLLAGVNEALARLRADGTMARLQEKYVGPLDEAAAPAAAPRAGFDASRFLGALPVLAQGARWTLALSLLSFVAALPVGLVVAVARMSRRRWLHGTAAAYVEVLRGTPLLVQVFFVYFVLPAAGLRLADHTAAVLALSINASAYIAEILRAGLESLDAGQREAAESLGMTRLQALRHVLVPQAVRRVIPPLTNESVALIKESSLVSVIGMTELTRTGQELASRHADPTTMWPAVALTYFVMTFPLTRLSARLEHRLRQERRDGGHRT